MNCEWTEHAPEANGLRRLQCSKCGRITIPLKPSARVIAQCGTWRPPNPDAWANEVAAIESQQSLGLGDMTASALESVGITKERWNAWKGEVGPCQGCVERQEWLNKMGRKVLGFLDR